MVNICEPNYAGNSNHTLYMIASCCNVFIITDEVCGSTCESHSKPNVIFFYIWKYLFICNGILMPYNHKLLIRFHYPREEFPKQREGRIGYNNIGFISQFANLFATEISVTIKVVPMQVVDIETPIIIYILIQHEYLAVGASLVSIVVGTFCFEKRWFPILYLFRFYGITGGDEFLQSECFKILRKEFREVAPLWVITR